ncbi:MAG: SIS domain-containing protein [Verrucomicrobiae bacterium]|nr:SIS domain-containing protein [Verrucomicrobiae bacterium]
MNENEKSVFLREIDEQPAALRNMLAFYEGEGRVALQRWGGLAAKHRRVVFCGMGTSEFAAEIVLPALVAEGIDATTIDAGEFLHYPRRVEGVLALISQSGESVETRKVAERMKGKAPIIGLTNDAGSALGRLADVQLLMQAGREAAISTKTYVNTLALLFLMWKALVKGEGIDHALEVLGWAADGMGRVDREGIGRAAKGLSDAAAIHFIARGPAMAAARQAALTFMEGTLTPAAAFTGGAFRHGPFELVDEKHRGVVFVPQGRGGDLLAAMAVEMAEKGSRVAVITDRPDFKEAGGKLCVLGVPSWGEELFPLSAAATQELLLDAVAREKGFEAGKFRHGQKITARE